MGCLSVEFSRVGGLSATCERVGGMAATASRIGDMNCRFSIVCSTGIMPPYLRISPEILWIWTDPAYNDVYSNTTWNIN